MEKKEYFICDALSILMKKETCFNRRVRKRVVFNGDDIIYTKCINCKNIDKYHSQDYTITQIIDGDHSAKLQLTVKEFNFKPKMYISDTVQIKLD
jgi:hypothetical protein